MSQPVYHAVSSNPDAPDDVLPDGQPQPPMGNEEQLLKSEHRSGDIVAWYAAVGAASAIALTSFLIILINGPFNLSYFAFHMPFNTLALFVFTISVVQLQPTSQPRTKVVGLERHQLGMIIALPLVCLGTTAMILNKLLHDAPHFTSWHGTFGICCLLWLIAQFFFGGATVWAGGAVFGGGMRAKMLWKYHRISGYVLFPALLFTVFLGGSSDWLVGHAPAVVAFLAYKVAPAVLLLALYVRVRRSKLGFS